MSKLWQRLLRQRLQVSAPPAGSGYRYWRFLIQSCNGAGSTGLEEIELRLTPGGATITVPGMATAESSFAQTYQKGDSVINQMSGSGIAGARWLATGNTNQWVAIDLGAPASPVELAYLPAQDAITRSPKNYVIQGSNEGLTGPWTDVKSVTGGPRSLAWQVISLI